MAKFRHSIKIAGAEIKVMGVIAGPPLGLLGALALGGHADIQGYTAVQGILVGTMLIAYPVIAYIVIVNGKQL